MMDIVEKLRRACKGKPAVIQWPHRGLHEAADEIERLRGLLESKGIHPNSEYVKDGLRVSAPQADAAF